MSAKCHKRTSFDDLVGVGRSVRSARRYPPLCTVNLPRIRSFVRVVRRVRVKSVEKNDGERSTSHYHA